MKKLLLLLLVVTLSCSSDDSDSSSAVYGDSDSPSAVSGCTDPESVNYNSNATVDDNSCKYSIVGEWIITKYTLGTLDVRAQYSYLRTTYYSDNSSLTSGLTINGDILLVTGVYTISGTNNSTLTMTNEFGDTTKFTILDITSNFVEMYSSDILGEEASIEAVKL
jgi:hypothetical protein